MSYEHILYERQGSAGVITLNRPERLNAFLPAMRVEIQSALKAAEADDAVRAVIVTGAGRGFCSGMDMSAGEFVIPPPADDDPHRDLTGEGRLVMSFYDLAKPVIGAVNGVAVGLGAALLLPMDIRLASTAAKFSFPFVRLGFSPEMACAWFLPRLVGPQVAMEWLVTGRMLTPEAAKDAGLVKEVVEPDALLPRALELAEEIAQASPVSVAIARRMCLRFESLGSPKDALKIDGPLVRVRLAEADAKEAGLARAEKRAPGFKDQVSLDYLQRHGLG